MKSFLQRIHDNHPVGRKSAPKHKPEPEKTAQRTATLPQESVESIPNTRSHKHGHKRSSSRAPRPAADSLPQTSGRPPERRTAPSSNAKDPTAMARTTPLPVLNSVLQFYTEPVPLKLPQETQVRDIGGSKRLEGEESLNNVFEQGYSNYPPKRSRHNTQLNPTLSSDIQRAPMPLAAKHEDQTPDQEALHTIAPNTRGKHREQAGMWIQDEGEGNRIPPRAGSHLKEAGQEGAGRPQEGRRRRASKERAGEGRDEREQSRNDRARRGQDHERGRSERQDRHQNGDRRGDRDAWESQRREADTEKGAGHERINMSRRDQIPEPGVVDAAIVPARTVQQEIEVRGQRERGRHKGEEKERRKRREKEQGENVTRDAQQMERDRAQRLQENERRTKETEGGEHRARQHEQREHERGERRAREQWEKEQAEREQNEKDEKEKDRRERDRREREQWERKQREREQWEREEREKEQRGRELREREKREREERERERQERERRGGEEREKERRERERREKEQRDIERREQEKRERETERERLEHLEREKRERERREREKREREERQREFLEREQREKREQMEKELRDKEKREEQEREREKRVKEKGERERREKQEQENRQREREQEMAQRERGRERKELDAKRKERAESRARRVVPPEDSSEILDGRRSRRPRGVRDDTNPTGGSKPDDGEHKHPPRTRELPGTPHENNAPAAERPLGGIGYPTSHREGKFTPRPADVKLLESGDSSDNSWRKPALVSHRRYKTEEGTASTPGPKHRAQPSTPLVIAPNLPQNSAEPSIKGSSLRHLPPGPPPKDPRYDGIDPQFLAKEVETRQREHQRPGDRNPLAKIHSAAQDGQACANDVEPSPETVERSMENMLKGKEEGKHQDSPEARFIPAIDLHNARQNGTMPQYVGIRAGQGPSDKTAHPSSKPPAPVPFANDAKSFSLENYGGLLHNNSPHMTPFVPEKESPVVPRQSPGGPSLGSRVMDTRAAMLPPQTPRVTSDSPSKSYLNSVQTSKPRADFSSSLNTLKPNHQSHSPVVQYNKSSENQRDKLVLDDPTKRTPIHHLPLVQNPESSVTPPTNPTLLSASQTTPPTYIKSASQSEAHNTPGHDSIPHINPFITSLVHDHGAPNPCASPKLEHTQNTSHLDQVPPSGSSHQPVSPSVPHLVAVYEVRAKTGQPTGGALGLGIVARPIVATRSGSGADAEPREDWHSSGLRRPRQADLQPSTTSTPRPATAMDIKHGHHSSAHLGAITTATRAANLSSPPTNSVSIPKDRKLNNPMANSNQRLSGPNARAPDLSSAAPVNITGMAIPRPSTAMDRRYEGSSKIPTQYPPNRVTPIMTTNANHNIELPLKRPSTATGFRHEVGRDNGFPAPLILSSSQALAGSITSSHYFNPPLIRPSVSQPNEEIAGFSPIFTTQASTLHDILSDSPSPSRLVGNPISIPRRTNANGFVDPHTLSNPDIQITRSLSVQQPIDAGLDDARIIPSRILRQVSNQPEGVGGHQPADPPELATKVPENDPHGEYLGRIRSTPPSVIIPATPLTRYLPHIMPSPTAIHSPPFGTTLKGRQAPTTSPIHPSESNVFRSVIQHPQLLELLSSPTRAVHKPSQPYDQRPPSTTAHIPTAAARSDDKRLEDTPQNHPAAIRMVNSSHALHTPPTPAPLITTTAPQPRHSPTRPTFPVTEVMKDSQTHAPSHYSPIYKPLDNFTVPTRGTSSYNPQQTPNTTIQLISKPREPPDPRTYRPVRPRETSANPGSQPLSNIGDRVEPSASHPQQSFSVDPSTPTADRRVYTQDAQNYGLPQGTRSKAYNMHAPLMQASSTLPPARYRTWQPEQLTHRPQSRSRQVNTSAPELPGPSTGRTVQMNSYTTSSRNAPAAVSTPVVAPPTTLPLSQPSSKKPPPDNPVVTSTRVPAPTPANSSRTAVDMARMISEDSTIDTPSSLTPPPNKRSTSRISVPASIHSQEPRRKPGIFSRLKSKAPQPDESDPSHPYTVWHPPSSARPQHRNDTSTGSIPDPKPISSLSSRVKVPPPINVPAPALPISERKSPNSKGFAAFRYLTTKRNRTMSGLSAEATDGATTNTMVGSPTASMTSQPPIRRPSLRDPMRATQDWRNREEQEVRVGGKARRKRPGVVFDVPEGAGERPRTKLSSRPRGHEGPSRKK